MFGAFRDFLALSWQIFETKLDKVSAMNRKILNAFSKIISFTLL